MTERQREREQGSTNQQGINRQLLTQAEIRTQQSFTNSLSYQLLLLGMML